MIMAAVQARMGSSRLPAKVLADVAGRPMIWHIVQRLKSCRSVDQVVIATADTPNNEPVRAMAREYGIPCFSGSENNVIDRLYSVCREYGGEALVRVTGDCPFVDPEIVDQLVDIYRRNRGQVDYVSNVIPTTFPHGLDAEVYPFTTLEKLWQECSGHPFWQDWFAGWFLDHRDLFRIENLNYPEDLTHRFRWTVDYPEDLEFARRVFQRLYRDGEVFHMRDMLALLEREPELNDLNSHYHTNTREQGIRTAYDAWVKSQPGVQNA